MVKVCTICNKDQEDSNDLRLHKCTETNNEDSLIHESLTRSPVIPPESVKDSSLADPCTSLDETPYSDHSENNFEYEKIVENGQLSSDEKDFISFNDSNQYVIRQEEINVKSEMGDDNASNSSWDNIGESLDFEMPECDVEIKLEEGKSLNIICDSVSELDSGASYVVSENSVNFLKDEVIDYSYEKFIQYSTDHGLSRNEVTSCFQCVICAEQFTDYAGLQTHVLEIHKEKAFSCDLCDKTFLFTSELNAHMRQMHSKDTNFRCSVCNKRFLSAILLNSHMEVHTVEKYVCCICNQSFEDPEIAKEHLSNHLNEEKFKCMVCNKNFTGNVALKNHIMTHTESEVLKYVNRSKIPKSLEKFRCEICDKSFMHLGHFTKHASVHMMVRPFCCTLCNERFADFSYLRAHVAKRHPGFALRNDT